MGRTVDMVVWDKEWEGCGVEERGGRAVRVYDAGGRTQSRVRR